MLRHYARTIPFAQLVAELGAARSERLVYSRRSGSIELWCYTSRAVYDRRWSPAVMAARGLVLDRDAERVIATPFPKFFNLGEAGAVIPAEPCEVFEKVDGSLIVIFHDGRSWRTATKGALDSPQALWAAERLHETDLAALNPGTTYLAEAVYPENRIVVRYADAGLVLLGAYREDGLELNTSELEQVAAALGWRMARRESFANLEDAAAHAQGLPESEEGYVVRFASGARLKIKGSSYARLHAMIARVTPLGLWDAMSAGEDLDVNRKAIPEEFWGDFDRIRALLERALDTLVADIAAAAGEVAHLSDKEVGTTLSRFPERLRRYIFLHRRDSDLLGSERTRERLLRDVRPTGDLLPGYEPSFAIRRVADDI